MKAILLALVLAPAAWAQRQPGFDSTVTRLSWGTVNVLVRADTVAGVHLWAETAPNIHKGKYLGFVAFFDPQAIDPWLRLAHAVVMTDAPPSDSAAALQTPPLVASDSSRLVLMRRREGDRWEAHTEIFLLDREGRHPWYIDAGQGDARHFLEALFVQAGRSRRIAQAAGGGIRESNPIEESGPEALRGNPFPLYPDQLRREGRSGEVWLSFVVQPDGKVDRTSFQILLSDDPAFASAAVAAYRRSRFRPARQDGVPIAARVYQRVSFRVGPRREYARP